MAISARSTRCFDRVPQLAEDGELNLEFDTVSKALEAAPYTPECQELQSHRDDVDRDDGNVGKEKHLDPAAIVLLLDYFAYSEDSHRLIQIDERDNQLLGGKDGYGYLLHHLEWFVCGINRVVLDRLWGLISSEVEKGGIGAYKLCKDQLWDVHANAIDNNHPENGA